MKTIPQKVKVKICGITNVPDGVAIAKFLPDYLGFITNYPKSPRSLKPKKVKEIISAVKKISKDIKFVGVFVNEKLSEIKKIVKLCGLDVVQLHGDESLSEIQELKKVCEVWKVIIVKKEIDVKNTKKYKGVADKILFDAGEGSGECIDLKFFTDEKIDILAGGLGIGTIDDALSKCIPEIIDANSKLEESPGKKDIEKVRKFIKKVRAKNY